MNIQCEATDSVRKWIFLFSCALLAIPSAAQDSSDPSPRSLLQVIWQTGIVSAEKAEIEARLGNDPRSLIELPAVTSWSTGLTGSDMREVNMIVPAWFVLDGSGMRNGVVFSVWCDNGSLYQDTLAVYDLKAAEGNATVEWAFDGEAFVGSTWEQKDTFILPGSHFPHDLFVRRLASADFLVLRIRGHAGVSDRMDNPDFRPRNVVVVPGSLAGDKSSLLSLIEGC